MKSLISLLLFTVAVTSAQHTIPFASHNNKIELSVFNKAEITAESVTVVATSMPKWVRFSQSKDELKNIVSRRTGIAQFTFSVDKTAPVHASEKIEFTIISANGEQWKKEISVEVAAPQTFELFQNYPNPFNPSTTISYQLPVNSNVSLKVYDILGKEVMTLVNGPNEAGYHQSIFNANSVASGVYFYRLIAETQNGKKEVFHKKMLMMK